MSSWTARKCVILPSSPKTGDMTALTQNGSPSFLLFLKVPFQTFPESIVAQSPSYVSLGVVPQAMTRGFCPIASSFVQPVVFSNIGFTYSIDPFTSVMQTRFALCSIALVSFSRSCSAFFLVAISSSSLAFASSSSTVLSLTISSSPARFRSFISLPAPTTPFLAPSAGNCTPLPGSSLAFNMRSSSGRLMI